MIARAEAPRRDASKPAAVDVDDVRRRSVLRLHGDVVALEDEVLPVGRELRPAEDRKSTRLNSSHGSNSYAGFRVKKKKERVPVDHLATVARQYRGWLPLTTPHQRLKRITVWRLSCGALSRDLARGSPAIAVA